jgi:hypothetical protein
VTAGSEMFDIDSHAARAGAAAGPYAMQTATNTRKPTSRCGKAEKSDRPVIRL